MGLWDKSLRLGNGLCDHGQPSMRRLAPQTGFSKSSVHRLQHKPRQNSLYEIGEIHLLSAPLTISLICCQIKSFRRASRCGEAMARRRTKDRRAGTASRGMCSDWAIFPPVCGHRGAPACGGVPERCHSSGPPWMPTVPLPQGGNGLSVRRRAVLWTFRAPSLGRHVCREFLRNA